MYDPTGKTRPIARGDTTGSLARHRGLVPDQAPLVGHRRTVEMRGGCAALLLLLTGCGVSREIAGEETAAEASAVTLVRALAECQRLYPDQVAQAVVRAGCGIKATDIIRPQLPYPELLDRENSY